MLKSVQALGLIAIALFTVHCSTYAELPGGKTYGVVAYMEQRSPFGTNVGFPAKMECKERIQHWYKPDEFPREHCKYMEDERSRVPEVIRMEEPKADPSSTPQIIPTPKVSPVATVKHATLKKRSVMKVQMVKHEETPSNEGRYYLRQPTPTPAEYFAPAVSSEGGGYRLAGNAAQMVGLLGLGALLRPDTSSSSTNLFSSTTCTVPCINTAPVKK